MKLYKSTRTGRYYTLKDNADMSSIFLQGIDISSGRRGNIAAAAEAGQLVLIGINYESFGK